MVSNDLVDEMVARAEEKKQRQQERDGTQKKRTAPLIEDGKTLDELVAGDKYEESIVQHERELGATDEEIWEFLNEL